MSLVLGSILLFILISPGLIFRYAYLQGTYAKQTFKISAVDEIFWALVPALFLQISGFTVVEHFLPYNIRLDFIYQLTTGNIDILDFGIIRKSLLPFTVYMLVLILIALLLGFLVRKLIKSFRLDLRYPFLRLNNEWYYLFSGEILDFLDAPEESRNIEMIQVDALIHTSEGAVVYSGTLVNYYLSKDNGLDRLYLSKVYRRRFVDDLGHGTPSVGYIERYLDHRYYSMPGDLFVITYNQIINLNITYHSFSGVVNEGEKEKKDKGKEAVA